MSIETSKSIIRSLPLKGEFKNDEKMIESLAEELDGYIFNLKTMHPLKDLYSRKANKDKFKKLRTAIIKIKNELDELDETQEYMLWSHINDKFEITGFDTYPSPSEICNLLSPIRKTCEELTSFKKTLKKDEKFNILDMVEDNLGKLYVKATGKKLARSNTSETSKSPNKPSGPLFLFIRDVFIAADYSRSPITSRDNIVFRARPCIIR